VRRFHADLVAGLSASVPPSEAKRPKTALQKPFGQDDLQLLQLLQLFSTRVTLRVRAGSFPTARRDRVERPAMFDQGTFW
jgi:hypothetical protein